VVAPAAAVAIDLPRSRSVSADFVRSCSFSFVSFDFEFGLV
jgi:hypothetical protein